MKWIISLPLFALACAGAQAPKSGPAIDALLEADDARIMWVAAHPDDETLASPLLAYACYGLRRPCHFVVMNRGQGGECLAPEGCHPDVGTFRAGEMGRSARAYGATLDLHSHFNASLPMSSFPTRQEIATRWIGESDPEVQIRDAIERFRPTVVVTFDPDHGYTGHPEHQLTARFTFAAVRSAKGVETPHVYSVLNHFWLVRLLGGGDANAASEAFDGERRCGRRFGSCVDLGLAITHAHRSQDADMALVRSLRRHFGVVRLRRIDLNDPNQAPGPLD